ncbi:MAG: glycosyltransferase family 4 protein [Acidobacteriota bacterium]
MSKQSSPSQPGASPRIKVQGSSSGQGPAIDYVSPLPPVRSGIADYSVDLLAALMPRGDVRILRLPEQPVAAELEARWQPVAAQEALRQEAGQDPAKGEISRLPLYQMGNNPHHTAVDRLARLYPGVMTLHDLFLHHLLSDQTLGVGEWQPYRDRLEADHGGLGAVAAVPRRWGGYSQASLFSLPAHGSLLRAQRGILVHSRWAAQRIVEDDPRIAVRVVPMGVPLPEAPSAQAGRAWRLARGLPAQAPLLGSFGFQTPIKRTDVAVAALARPGLESVHLVVVGEVSPHLDLLSQAQQLGVADRVHVTGFVPFEEFEAAIAACDLCLNLRYPTAGETSASLLRVLALGRPAVVSDFAQFAELPSSAVVSVPLGDDEEEQLATQLAQLLAAPELLAAMGAAAREHVRREHAPERAAKAVLEACGELAGLTPPGSAPELPEESSVPATGLAPSTLVPSTLAWGVVEGSLAVEGAEEPWPAGARRRLRLRLTNHGLARWLPAEAGPGGVAVEVRVEGADGRPLEPHRPWLPLPRGVAPGESLELEVEVRRPPGPGALWIEPHVSGAGGFGALGGPTWRRSYGS